MNHGVKVVGGGLAGLSAAVDLATRGHAVELSEAAAQAGGRCRSYFDAQLGLTIDNGNHLILSGNRAVADYVRAIGAADHLIGPAEAHYSFIDLPTRQRWSIRPNGGALPWWILDATRRVPGTSVGDYLKLLALLRARSGQRIDQAMATHGPLWTRLIEPFLVAALNTPATEGDAMLAATLIRETLMRGGRAYRPRLAHPTLAAALIDPAVAHIERHGGRLRLNRRLRALTIHNDLVTQLTFTDGTEEIPHNTSVILAVPPWVAQELVPDLPAPDAYQAIVNAHFRVDTPPHAEPMIGLIGGVTEWIFRFPDRLSTTTSAANHLVDEDRETLARRIWAEVATVHDLPPALPAWQIVKEKRATFAATPEQALKRPPARTDWRNLFLAGDWTDTGLPATIEGAIRSGMTAASLAAGHKSV